MVTFCKWTLLQKHEQWVALAKVVLKNLLKTLTTGANAEGVNFSGVDLMVQTLPVQI